MGKNGSASIYEDLAKGCLHTCEGVSVEPVNLFPERQRQEPYLKIQSLPKLLRQLQRLTTARGSALWLTICLQCELETPGRRWFRVRLSCWRTPV